MTKPYGHEMPCPHCGKPITRDTAFSRWLRALNKPLDSSNYNLADVDFVWHHYRAGWFICLEEKCYGVEPSKAQKDLMWILTQFLNAVKRLRVWSIFRNQYTTAEFRGYYLIVFERTSPDDSSWVRINKDIYNGAEAARAIFVLLENGYLPNSMDKAANQQRTNARQRNPRTATSEQERRTMEKLPDKMTNGEKYDPAMQVTTKEEAQAYFEACVEHTMRINPDAAEREEAERIERSNIGYYSGYYDDETRARVHSLYGFGHPLFGTTTPTVEEALQAGIDAANKRK